MKKRTSKILVVLMVTISMLVATACGGGESNKDKNPYEGKWVAVVAEMIGVQVPVEEALGGSFAFEFDGGGKGTMSQDEETFKIKWSLDGENIIVDIDGEDVVGNIEDINTIVFDNMLDMGVKMTFGREGTDAVDPTNYLSEDEKAVVGLWQSESVSELLGDTTTNMEGVSDIHDAMKLSFLKDHTVEVTYKGENIGSFTWDATLGYVTLETGDDLSIYITMNEDGTMLADYSKGEDYYTFKMVKQQ